MVLVLSQLLIIHATAYVYWSPRSAETISQPDSSDLSARITGRKTRQTIPQLILDPPLDAYRDVALNGLYLPLHEAPQHTIPLRHVEIAALFKPVFGAKLAARH
jgi:hypothetical protein